MSGIRDSIELFRNGCKLHSDCFTCPFTDCIDNSSTISSGKPTMLAKAEAIRLRKKGYSLEAIARRLGREERHIQRLLIGVP